MLGLQKPGHWVKECPNKDKPLRRPVQNAKEVAIGEPTARWAEGQPLRWPWIDGTLCSRWSPLFNISITGLEPRANLDVAGRTISFLLDKGAA